MNNIPSLHFRHHGLGQGFAIQWCLCIKEKKTLLCILSLGATKLDKKNLSEYLCTQFFLSILFLKSRSIKRFTLFCEYKILGVLATTSENVSQFM